MNKTIESQKKEMAYKVKPKISERTKQTLVQNFGYKRPAVGLSKNPEKRFGKDLLQLANWL